MRESKVISRAIEAEHAISGKLSVLGGVLLALFITVVGVQLNSMGQLNSQPYGNGGQIILVITLAISFGYDFGLAMKHDHPERGVFLFWAAFLGTFFGIVAAAVALSVFFGSGLSSLLSVGVLVLGTAAFAVIIQSGLVEHSRMRFLKRGLDNFSNRISAGLFSGYGVAAISNPFIGTFVGVIITFLAYTLAGQLPDEVQTRINQLKS